MAEKIVSQVEIDPSAGAEQQDALVVDEDGGGALYREQQQDVGKQFVTVTRAADRVYSPPEDPWARQTQDTAEQDKEKSRTQRYFVACQIRDERFESRYREPPCIIIIP